MIFKPLNYKNNVKLNLDFKKMILFNHNYRKQKINYNLKSIRVFIQYIKQFYNIIMVFNFDPHFLIIFILIA